MKTIITTLLFLLLSFPSGSQIPVLPIIFEAEQSLREKFIQLGDLKDDSEIDSLNAEIIQIFSSVLNIGESFSYAWPDLDMIGKVKSNDQKVNIFTWFSQNNKGEYQYSGIIQQRIPLRRKKSEIIIHPLNDNSRKILTPEEQILTHDNWLGALYYSIADFTYRRKTVYVLLGFDFHNAFSNKKLIEILSFEEGKATFGFAIKRESGSVLRLIFEYSSEIVMALRYDQKLHKIVFDHLAPLDPIFKGVYRFYVPDGSYDALRFERGEFQLLRDVDARNY